jgi:hypothetical protein
MGPEAKAQVTEFTRRLRAALTDAPNHVRVEAALEVESHVCDVLSRGGEGTESEQVSRILAGFGSPEEYARALISQMPAVQAVTLGGSFREMRMATGDLARGGGRLALAALRQTGGLLGQLFGLLRRAAAALLTGIERARGPVGNAAQWVRERGRGGAYMVRRSGTALIRQAQKGARLGRHAVRLAHGAVGAGRWMVRLAVSVFFWLLKAAGLAALAGVTLATLALAVGSAVAPDLVGFGVYSFQYEVDRVLEGIRTKTVYPAGDGLQQTFLSNGVIIGNRAMAASILLALLWVGLLLWFVRRRRQSVAGH